MLVDREYRSHTAFMEKFQKEFGFVPETDESTIESFEAIHDKTKSLTSEDAKEFLSTLDSDELNTIKAYHHLKEPIDIESLNEEQAYNLLAKYNERLDIDGDKLISNGEHNFIGMLNQEMPLEEKKKIFDTLKILKEMGMSDVEEYMIGSMISDITNREGLNKLHSMALREMGMENNLDEMTFEPNYLDNSYIDDLKEKIERSKNGMHLSESARNILIKFVDTYENLDTLKEQIGESSQTTEALLSRIADTIQNVTNTAEENSLALLLR